jgi:hypothetical protein
MHPVIRSVAILGGALALLGGACAKQTVSSNDSAASAPPAQTAPAAQAPPATSDSTTATPSPVASTDTSTGGDQATIARLEREARALAKTSGCKSDAECRTAPVGWRACGGPRTYVTYCAATTDSAALYRKLKALETAEKAYIAKAGMMSTCEFRMPPRATLQGGVCREASGAP